MNVLSIRNLSKSFGQQQIIKNLNMSVPEGSVFGFIGQNGAGKTTTMKMVLGLLQPDQGEILCGFFSNSRRISNSFAVSSIISSDFVTV